MVTRRRLTPDERRRQLVEVGADLFASRPYESVLMEEVAERAGVSRALLYKHFASKRDLFAAVYREAADGLLDATELDPDVPFADQVVAGLDTHLDYFAANSSAVLAANRTLSGDPTIQAIITGELAVLRQRMIDVSGLAGSDRDVLAAVLTAWLVFVRVLVLDWLAGAPLDRPRLRDICVGALTGALGDLGPRIEQARLSREEARLRKSV
jgi:AcrR family transcriptional regulator